MPFTLATTMGIVAVALENTAAFPTYPNRMTATEIGAGLALPYAAQTIAGAGGAGAGRFSTVALQGSFSSHDLLTLYSCLVLLLMFMSCTSAISSVLIGASTVLSYDVYKTCKCSSAQLHQTCI